VTGDAGEKGEQVKPECAFQQCRHCDCSFINNSYDVSRGMPFLEAEEEDRSSSSPIKLKWAMVKSGTVATLHSLPPPISNKNLPV